MIFRRNRIKIKESTKVYPYSRHRGGADVSVWTNLSIIEKFSLFILPSLHIFMFYAAFDGLALLTWWMKLIIAITIEGILILIIYGLINWLVE